MKKLKKILLAMILLAVVLGLAAVIVAVAYLDRIVKAGIETVAPKITQTAVTLDGVSISMLSGSVGLNDDGAAKVKKDLGGLFGK